MRYYITTLRSRCRSFRWCPWLIPSVCALTALALHAPAVAQPYVDVTASAGINVYTTGDPITDWGGGVAFIDYDNDGDEDIYVAAEEGAPNYLYRNNGDGTFTNVAGAAGVADTLWTKGVKCADYDNDGDTDIFLGNLYAENCLYRNNGDGTFTDVATAAGVDFAGATYGAGWADYDNDGHLDLYVVNYAEVNLLYHNNGNGTFTDVAAAKGVLLIFQQLGFDCTWLDIDNDNDQDLYVINDLWDGNALFRNNGNGTFTDISSLNGSEAGVSMSAMGTAVGDYDGDGFMDIYVTNVQGSVIEPDGNAMLHNNGDGTFTEVGRALHVRVQKTGWGTAFADFDNDGDEDLYVTNGSRPNDGGGNTENVLFRKDGADFTDITSTSGCANNGAGYGVAYGDINNDGFLEMFVLNRNAPSVLYANTTNNNNWIKVKTVGVTSNRDGIGARIRVTAGGKTQRRDVRGGASYCSQHSLITHFGLGSATNIGTLRIRWPSGAIDIHNNVAVNHTVQATEGGGLEIVPVFITRFDAAAVDDGVELTWDVFRDEPVDGFRLYRRERSQAGERPLGGLISEAEHRYIDRDVVPGGEYTYAMTVVKPDGSVIRSQDVSITVPRATLALEQNIPNPFNPTTAIRFVLPEAGAVELAVFDVDGRHVITLARGQHAPGPHTVTWNGRNAAGDAVATGVYFYRLSAGKSTLTRKMILLK